MSDADRLSQTLRALIQAGRDERTAIEDIYQQLENADLIKRVVVHRYICKRRGCQLATVIKSTTG